MERIKRTSSDCVHVSDNPDYGAVEVTFTIPFGAENGTSNCIGVSIVDDNELEGPEEFFLTLTSCSPNVAGIAQALATKRVLITDDECKSASKACVVESYYKQFLF